MTGVGTAGTFGSSTGSLDLRSGGEGTVAPLTWRILRDPAVGGAWNMAVDVALARHLENGHGILRLYRWSRPTLSFGRNQKARDRYDPFALRSLGVDVVRRPTGGREVLHDRELTYSVILPLRSQSGLRSTYRTLHDGLVEALRSLGVNAHLAGPGARSPGPDAGPCFADPVANEVVVEGRKIVGSAQSRIGESLLQHGSLILAPPSVSLDALLRAGAPSANTDREPVGSRAGTTLADVMGEPVGFPGVAAAVEAAMAGTLGGAWSRGELTSGERVAADELLPHYQSPDWTWRS